MNIFKELKKKIFVNITDHYRDVVVGDDIASILLINHFLKNKNCKSLKFINESSVNFDDLFIPVLHSLRGDQNVKLFKKLFPEIELSQFQERPQFYKDQRFVEFGGRIKPSNDLLYYERFFLDQKYDFNIEDVLTQEVRESVNSFEKFQIKTKVLSISRGSGERSDCWILECQNGDVISCNNIFFSSDILTFSNLLKGDLKKNQQLLKFFNKAQKIYSLAVKFKSDIKINAQCCTYFFPQYISQERGHFIGEFFPQNKEDSSQEFLFFSHLAKSEEGVEEISKKISLLKRSLNRIFPALKNSQLEKNIYVTDKTPSIITIDEDFNSIKNLLPNCYFLGLSAPIDFNFYESFDLSFSSQEIYSITRALFSFNQTIFNIE